MEKNWLFPSLREISLSKLAQGIVYHVADNIDKGRKNLKPFDFSTHIIGDKACDWVDDELHLPSSVEESLKKQVKFVCLELHIWIENLVTSTQTYSFLYVKSLEFLPCVVWTPDGFIDYEKTAVNLLGDSGLSLVQKYCLACSYCMVDEIERFWRMHPCEIDLDNIPIVGNRIIIYWNARSKFSFDEPITDLMISYCKNFNAVEYLWNCLDITKKLASVRLCNNPKILTRWLKSLDENCLKKVLEKDFDIILFIYTYHTSYGKYVYQLWIMIKDFISGDNFVTLLTHVKRSVNTIVEDINLTTSLLIDIWNSSSYELKRYAFQSKSGSCIYNICGVLSCDMRESKERDDRIIQVVLSDASPVFREEFFQNECVKFISYFQR